MAKCNFKGKEIRNGEDMKKILKRCWWWLDINEKIFRLYLKANKCKQRNHNRRANYFYYKLYRRYACFISPSAKIKSKINFPHPLGIVIGGGVEIGKNVTIYQNVTLGRKYKDKWEYPIIEDNVTIYCNATIIGNVKIGKNAVIGCNSIVLRDVRENETVSGVVK